MTVVLWDIDGTLLWAGGAGAQCFRAGLASLGRTWPEAELDFGGRGYRTSRRPSLLAATGAMQIVATGNVRSIARHELAAVGLEQLLAVHLGAFDEHADRADLVQLALRRVEAAGHHCEPTRCWVVGDTPRDLAAARAAGVRCALLATGTFERDVLAALDPDLVLADLHDVDVLVEAAASDASSP